MLLDVLVSYDECKKLLTMRIRGS